MRPVIDEPRVLTRSPTALGNSAVDRDELLDLLQKSSDLARSHELATTSITFSPALNVVLSDSSPDYWLERHVNAEQLEPWRTFDSWRTMPIPVELFTSGTNPTSTTVTLIRQLLRRYRLGKNAFFQSASELDSLAAAQRVAPTADISKLRGDFWPDEDRIDDFVTEVRRWRDGDAEEDENG